MLQWQRGRKLLDVMRKFLWPIGIFRDASRGSPLERAAAYRHNRNARGCLPQYMSHWLLVAIVLAGTGTCLEQGHNFAASVLCWILVTYTMTELAVLSAIYIVLTAWEY